MDLFANELSLEDRSLIKEEEMLLSKILDGLRQARQKTRLDFHGISERLKDLREQASAARAEDLPALFDQMNSQRAVLEQMDDSELPNRRSPYFARMQLEEAGRKRDILIGYTTFLDVDGAPINDWRNAPIAAVFFNYREGEEFEQELPGRLATGKVLRRHLLTIKDERLVYIGTPHKTYRMNEDTGIWGIEDAVKDAVLSGGGGKASRGFSMGTGRSGRPSPEVSALLDQNQYSILSAHEDDPVLVLGGAGCGKTTVALHRLATLNFKDRDRFAQHRLAVIVPDEGLVRLSRKLLDSLGLHRVLVSSFDDFFPPRVHQIIGKLPKKICELPPGFVTTFKRHSALRSILPDYIELVANGFCKILEAELPGSQVAQEYLRSQVSVPLSERLASAKSSLLASEEAEGSRAKRVIRVFSDLEKRMLNIAADRVDLFLNKTLLSLAVERSGGQLRPAHADEVYKHTREQTAESAASKLSGVDLDQFATVDGGSLSHEFEDDLAGTIDAEDFSVLYELRRLKLGLKAGDDEGLHQFSHIVIDEAQDLAPIELYCLGSALHKRGTVTIAGDSAQQIDPSSSFVSWEEVLSHIGVPKVKAQHLTTTYRSPKPVAEFAHKVLGAFAPREMPQSFKDGVPVTVSVYPNDGHMMITFADNLSELIAREPLASVAVIARNTESATKIFKMMSDVPKTRLVFDGNFDFKPGVDVVDVKQVKGLEFDYVIIPDASSYHYPDTAESRRLLHVAATRAIHQLWVISVGQVSEIVPR
jgi:DNA helicase-2/ATP-dependent DNA helicase PcrA